MWFVLLSGKALVKTPKTGDEVWIEPGGKHQILLALDVPGKGHLTFYPGMGDSIALQLPLEVGYSGLTWNVAWEGPC